MGKNKKLGYEESCDYVLSNLEITTDLLPVEVIESLLMEEFNDDTPFTIFCFAYNAYKVSKGETLDVDIEKINEVFTIYQSYLSLESLKRNGLASFESVKLFDFDNYNQDAEVVL